MAHAVGAVLLMLLVLLVLLEVVVQVRGRLL